jgi:hypothetical protein
MLDEHNASPHENRQRHDEYSIKGESGTKRQPMFTENTTSTAPL